VSVLAIEENKTKLDQAKLARNGRFNLHKSIQELQRNSQKEELEITTFVETLIQSQRQSGATQLIPRRDGSTVTQ
jgi:dTDP-glucose pyrophosphorylase